jgi:hypothetical protein
VQAKTFRARREYALLLMFLRLMSLARRKLEQRRRRALPSLHALLTNQPPGEIVHACRRHVAQRAEIDIARCLAARAFDLQPWVDAVMFVRDLFPMPATLDFVPLEHHIAQKSIYEELITLQPNDRRFSGIDLQRKKTRNEGD